jgi:transmembrane sensor
MSIDRFRYLFHQFVNKTATPKEIDEFMAMMKGEDYDREVQDLLDEFWNEPSSITPLGEAKAEEIFNKIMASSANKETVRIGAGRRWLQIAAAVIIIGLASLFYMSEWRYPQPRLVKQEKSPMNEGKPGRRFINLPDGSSVILNENSTLRLSDLFSSNGKREVYLEGEAYFDISHDSLRPFVVHTGKIQTTVLGTAFNVNANPLSGTITVTVTRGKVKVGDDKHIFNIVDPDEQVVYGKNYDPYIKTPVKAEKVVAWINEDIYFDDVSLKDVANQLQERFSVSIHFSNEAIKSCRFSATFLKSQSLEQILNVIGDVNRN